MPTAPRLDDDPCAAVSDGFQDYALLDTGRGRKLERYGPVTVVRPEPQCFWDPRLPEAAWAAADAAFDPKGEEDEGRWRTVRPVPESWPLECGGFRVLARLSPFRHLGLFPEQASNWRLLAGELARLGRPARVLNLFGYTGAASLAAAAAGAEVTHVDASRKSVAQARENAAASGLETRPIRWIVEDARRYAARERRRGSLYQGIILDPPKYGRGPEGEVWRLTEDLGALLADCAALLAPDAGFLVLNAYAERVSALALASLLSEALAGRGGRISYGELALREAAREDLPRRSLGLSLFARWRAA